MDRGVGGGGFRSGAECREQSGEVDLNVGVLFKSGPEVGEQAFKTGQQKRSFAL